MDDPGTDDLRKDGPRGDTESVKCLIVDDLAENLLALEALLRADGVEVLQARSAREALELLLVHDVALALVDVQMPEIDGFELAELMRGSDRTRTVPIIFVTAGSRDQQRMFQGYESGAVDFLFKPIEAHVLRSKANVFFQLHRQRRQLARDLVERTETLRLQELFTAVLGHDLRGPLAAILMAAQVLSRRPDDSVRPIGERLMRSGRWMSTMIEDLLDLSRVRTGDGIRIERRPVDLAVLARRVMQDRQPTCPERSWHFDADGDTHGDWDEDRLQQVLSNLMGNAISHGLPSGPVAVVVDGRDAAQVRLSVGNAGVIPEAVLPHIFDPFRSGRSGSSRTGGLGLGLFIVREIVKAHRGTVTVDTSAAAGERTAFEVMLPRR